MPLPTALPQHLPLLIPLPQHLAARHGHTAAVTALLEAGADAYAADERGRTALLDAAVVGAASCMEALITQGGADPDYQNELGDGEHALLLAAQGGHLAAVKQLVQLGAKVNRTDTLGRSALWLAASRGDALMVAYLCALTPQAKHIRDFADNRTPLQAAQLAGHHAVAQLLAAHLATAPQLRGAGGAQQTVLVH